MSTIRRTLPEWVDRVVDVDTNSSIKEVRALFSHCGEMRGVYPWKSDKSAQQHYFIEFTHKSDVLKAKAQGKLNHGFSVHALSMVPQLIERCQSVVPHFASGQADLSPAISNTDMLSTSFSFDSNRHLSRCAGVERTPNRTPLRVDPTGSSYRRLVGSEPNAPASRSTQVPQLDAITSTTTVRPNGSHLTFSSPIFPSAQSSLSSFPTLPSFSSSHSQLNLTICGMSIPYDLDRLEDNPDPIIALLQTAGSGRDNWMVVGGHYRRLGNINAAMTVVATMVQFMTERGTHEWELKPAYLMLSTCQRDLGKRARTPEGEDSDASKEHFSRAVEYLQKVYGSDSPALDTLPSVPPALPRSESLPINRCHSLNGNSHPPVGPNPSPAPHTTFALLPPNSSTPAPNVGRTRILEREIQCLRTRLETINTALTQTVKLKRLAESDLSSERAQRRKVERQLDDVERQLDVTKRMEGFALENVKREVEARRRAERELAERERNGEGGKRAVLEGLAEMFGKAARGETSAAMEVFEGVGPSDSNRGKVKSEKILSP
ncbi:hypothetical protein JAAARDRAFT_194035 [Jaapia argillacea MUCL 33604]|uniref:RRM domain-containing protein n=1 Tax=Jaapia argillacea MUCL 33604 TaxID=933084 RepID=A0A067PSF8_9AGAM|nr:hypothetical protein JAAARDRAFT_194035 [Jaapia argillacea MUCL 33604]